MTDVSLQEVLLSFYCRFGSALQGAERKRDSEVRKHQNVTQPHQE